MGWTERQRAMLAEMGIRLWVPETPPASASDDVGTATRERRWQAGIERVRRTRAHRAHLTKPSPSRWRRPTCRCAPAACRIAGPASRGRRHRQRSTPTRSQRARPPARCARSAQDARARCSATEACRPTGWSSAMRPMPTTMPPASRSPAGPASCSTTCSPRCACRAAKRRGPASAYVTPSVKCRPPAGRVPEPGEIERCRPYLARQVGLVQPRLIIAMGRVAAQAVVGTRRADRAAARPRAPLRRRAGRRDVSRRRTCCAIRRTRPPRGKTSAWRSRSRAVPTRHRAIST